MPNDRSNMLVSAWSLCRSFLYRTIRLNWRTTILLERSLDEPIREVKPKINVVIKQATPEDLAKYKALVSEIKYRRFEQRNKAGKICFIALDHDKLSAYSWVSLVSETETGTHHKVKLNDKEAYCFDTLVIPKYRNNGLQSALIAKRLKYLRSLAYRKALTMAREDNNWSLKALASAGFKPKRALFLFTVFGLRFHRWRDAVNN